MTIKTTGHNIATIYFTFRKTEYRVRTYQLGSLVEGCRATTTVLRRAKDRALWTSVSSRSNVVLARVAEVLAAFDKADLWSRICIEEGYGNSGCFELREGKFCPLESHGTTLAPVVKTVAEQSRDENNLVKGVDTAITVSNEQSGTDIPTYTELLSALVTLRNSCIKAGVYRQLLRTGEAENAIARTAFIELE